MIVSVSQCPARSVSEVWIAQIIKALQKIQRNRLAAPDNARAILAVRRGAKKARALILLAPPALADLAIRTRRIANEARRALAENRNRDVRMATLALLQDKRQDNPQDKRQDKLYGEWNERPPPPFQMITHQKILGPNTENGVGRPLSTLLSIGAVAHSDSMVRAGSKAHALNPSGNALTGAETVTSKNDPINETLDALIGAWRVRDSSAIALEDFVKATATIYQKARKRGQKTQKLDLDSLNRSATRALHHWRRPVADLEYLIRFLCHFLPELEPQAVLADDLRRQLGQANDITELLLHLKKHDPEEFAKVKENAKRQKRKFLKNARHLHERFLEKSARAWRTAILERYPIRLKQIECALFLNLSRFDDQIVIQSDRKTL